MSLFRRFTSFRSKPQRPDNSEMEHGEVKTSHLGPSRWSMGVLNDRHTDDVPGSILLMPTSQNDEPHEPNGQATQTQVLSVAPPDDKKRTADGLIILNPQPDDSPNDPLNWPAWKRNAALWSLGFYCMVGGGMTPILAAGFVDVADTYKVTIPEVARTTGLYMMGLGIGAVVSSPTAILYGKRPIYLIGTILFCISAVWCAASPSYLSLLLARVVQGIAVSPCESLPSASIAELYFLHERAFRVGIYTLLLLGGKNLVPLVSAVVIQGLGWRWVFWIVAVIVGCFSVLLFFFLPETFWDRGLQSSGEIQYGRGQSTMSISEKSSVTQSSANRNSSLNMDASVDQPHELGTSDTKVASTFLASAGKEGHPKSTRQDQRATRSTPPDTTMQTQPSVMSGRRSPLATADTAAPSSTCYTTYLKSQPPRGYTQTLRPYHGRLRNDSWLRVAFRPFVLFAYPAVLWSTVVYSLSVGWLIVLSESVAHIYQDPDGYNFSALGTGLVYLSPFIGGILGTAVAGKVSDVIVRWMSKRNGGLYEPEFRLVMALPVAVTTCIGLMGFGWSAEERDRWIVPTVFFGIISFGCSVGGTTAITFCVDSYREYAGEALVTLNFSKNVFHGLVFSLFFNTWLEHDGAKNVFLALGGVQLACLLTTVPMYIFGKRARMWTVRRRMMERF